MYIISHPLAKSALIVFLKGFCIGIFALSGFYYVLLVTATGDFMHPIQQFQLFQPWMTLLIVGFGIQMGLFMLLKKGYRITTREKHDVELTAGTGTAASGIAMVACCAHHAVDLLPILGFSAAALFLSEYQQELLMFGVAANAAGILVMLWFVTGRAMLHSIITYFLSKKDHIT